MNRLKLAVNGSKAKQRVTNMTELEQVLSSSTSVECLEKHVTADVQSCDADANHSLLPAHQTYWRHSQNYVVSSFYFSGFQRNNGHICHDKNNTN